MENDIKQLLNQKIAVLAGGLSSEREISLKSGRAVFNALLGLNLNTIFLDLVENFKQQILKVNADVVFIALHGKQGEDGTIQKILEESNICYTGSGPQASYNALSKIISKEIFTQHKIKIAPYQIFKKNQNVTQGEMDKINLPAVIKPSSEGSSIGLSIVHEKRNLKSAIEKAFEYGDDIIIEDYIKGDEITVAILDRKPLPVVKITPGAQFYDYEAKYFRNDTKYEVPAPIDENIYNIAQRIGLESHQALGCCDFSRVDMIISEKKEIYVLEVNTIPGLTERSLLPMAAKCSGLSFPKLCVKILCLALKKKRLKYKPIAF